MAVHLPPTSPTIENSTTPFPTIQRGLEAQFPPQPLYINVLIQAHECCTTPQHNASLCPGGLRRRNKQCFDYLACSANELGAS